MSLVSQDIVIPQPRGLEIEPLDSHIAEGIAINGLLCAVQQRLVSERMTDVFASVREDDKPHKHRSYAIARAMGSLPLSGEDLIDDFIEESARLQNHGTISANLEKSELGDIIWKGYDPNSTRFLTLFKRYGQTLMTNGAISELTMWELKAHPRS